MKLTCLGSSSKGNCYLLQASDGEVLMIECGIPLREVKRALGWHLSGIAGCLVTHSHDDHCKHMGEVLRSGIRCLALPSVVAAKADSRTRHFCKPVQPLKGYRIGGFRAVPLPVAHDVPCVGWVIEHDEMGRLLFVTDTMMLEHRVKGLNHLMLECNYSDRILQENIRTGLEPASMARRLLESHMELETAKEIVRSNDMEAVSEVILLHLSARNGDPDLFTAEMQKVAGKPVYVASAGFKTELSLTPF